MTELGGSEERKVADFYPGGLCPDCQEPIPDDAGIGDACSNCGHVWRDAQEEPLPAEDPPARTWIERKFVINSLGECYRGGDHLFGSIDVGDLAKRLYGDPTVKPTERDFEAEFDRLARENLNEAEYTLYRRVIPLQQLNNSRFRIYGWIDKDDRPVVVLVTEFAWWVEDPVFWDRLERVVKDTEAGVWVMHESPHCDRRGKEDPETGRVVWREGFNHGRPERQVELSWELRPAEMITDVVGQMMQLAHVTADVWAQAGVGVC